MTTNIDVAQIMANWPEGRKRFCRGMDPERFLAELHTHGWNPAMVTALEREVRARVAADPSLPIIEHMLDAAIVVRYPREPTD